MSQKHDSSKLSGELLYSVHKKQKNDSSLWKSVPCHNGVAYVNLSQETNE